MHNIAQFWWCGMYAVLKSKANELGFFVAYLSDRVNYAQALGRVKSAPRSKEKLLATGEDLTRRDVEKLFAAEIRRGAKAKHPEGLASYRWSFPWKGFVLVGIPDGIAPKYVFEQKEAKNRFWFNTASRPVATTQADLYGVFFERPQKRVEITILDEGTVEIMESPVDHGRANTTLEKFASAVSGRLPAPPKPFKCKNCVYRQKCPVRRL